MSDISSLEQSYPGLGQTASQQNIHNRSHKAQQDESSLQSSSKFDYSWREPAAGIRETSQEEIHQDEPAPDGDNIGEVGEEEDIPVATCMERFLAEINPCQPWFLKKHPEHDRPIDIAKSFGPLGCNVLFFKVTGTGFVMGTAIYSFVTDTDKRHWWLAYSTNWVLLTGTIYMVLSLFMTLFGAPQPYKRVSSPLVKSAWLLYSFSAHFALLNAVFWWIYIYEPGETRLDYLNFIPHSILPFTITFDGLNVNHIPLRWQHYTGFVIPMEMLYVFWTYSQNALGDFPNPDLPDDANDDAIYPPFNWDDKGIDPLIMSVIGIFGIGPFIWMCMWLFSQYWLFCCCFGDRRMYYEDPRKKRDINKRVVEGAGLYVKKFDWDEDGYDDGENKEWKKDADEGASEDVGDKPQSQFRNRWEELASANRE